MNAHASTQKATSLWLENPWVQLVAGLLGMMMISSTQYAWTLFVPSLTHTFKWSLAAVQFAFTLYICTSYASPLTGYLLDKFGTKILFTIAALCVGLGWSSIGYAKSTTALYCYYTIAGIGVIFVYTGAIASAIKWFPKRRGLASGVMAAGFGSGAAPFIPLVAYLLSSYGYSKAFLYTGMGFGLVLLAVAQIIRFPTTAVQPEPATGPTATAPDSAGETGPTPVETFKTRQSTRETAPAPDSAGETGLTPVEMFKTFQFYLTYLLFVGMASGFMLVTAQLKPFSAEYGIASNIVVLALTLGSIANGLGRVVWGAISDKLGRERSMIIDFLIAATAVGLLPILGRNPIIFVVLSVLAMFNFGPIFAFFPPITADRFGTKYLATNYGFMYSAKGIGGIVGGWISSLIILSLGWSFTFYGAAALAVFSAIGALTLMRIPKPAQRPVPVIVRAVAGR